MKIDAEKMRYAFLTDEEAKYVYQEYPEMKSKTWCPTCDGTDHRCDHEMQRSLAKCYANAGIGMTYMRIGWDDFEGSKDILKFCSDYISKVKAFKENNVGMCLLGANGIGKTTSVSLLFKDLVKLGYKPYFTTYQKLVSMLGDSFYDGSIKKRYNEKILQSPFLAIDDCGKELSNRLTQNAIDNVLRERVQASRPTFMTSNLTEGELYKEYGRSSFSLIVESSVIFRMDDVRDRRASVKKKKVAQAENGIIHPIV